jgi:hypothetical protein
MLLIFQGCYFSNIFICMVVNCTFFSLQEKGFLAPINE